MTQQGRPQTREEQIQVALASGKPWSIRTAEIMRANPGWPVMVCAARAAKELQS